MLRHIIAVDVKLNVVLSRQLRHEFLIRIRFSPTQPVIEMNDRRDNAEFVPQLQQQPQKRNGINPTGDSDANTIPGPKQFVPLDVGKDALGQ